MEWYSCRDPLYASRDWQDGLPSLADTPSPVRKRKLFGGSSPQLNSGTHGRINKSPPSPSGRQVAGLPSKKARMSNTHPLSRTSVLPMRQHQSSIYKQSAHHFHTQPLARRSPSPSHITPSNTTRSRAATIIGQSSYQTSVDDTHTHLSRSNTLPAEERTCVNCRRTAHSLLQLSSFHKCDICGGLSCAVCARTCQMDRGNAESDEDENDSHDSCNGDQHDVHNEHGGQTNSSNPRVKRRQYFQDDDGEESNSPEQQNQHTPKGDKGCGKVVCRGCSTESAHGMIQCYRCYPFGS